MKLADAMQMKKLEENTFRDFSVPSILLMENAAHGFFNVLKREIGDLQDKKTIVFCGKGNNGGDGYAIARYLKNAGCKVCVYSLADEEKITGDALTNYNIIKKMDIPITRDLSTPFYADIIVDAIFGIGFHGEVKGAEKDAITLINESPAITFSVDCPSGCDASSGHTGDACVKADYTVTFGLAKIGLYLYPAKEYANKIIVCDISIPKMLTDSFTEGAYLLDDDILNNLPERDESGHKGSFGRALCVCGSKGFTGAGELAATAAQKSGCGLVTAAVPADVSDVMASKFTEIMTLSLETDSKEAAKQILAAQKDALLLGCGIGRSDYAKELSLEIIEKCDVPMVIDADGLYALSQNTEILNKRKAPTILTPHIAEFARLLGVTADEVLSDRINLSLKFAKEHGMCLVLKSADTIVAMPDGRFYICGISNSGLAKGGSGDTLAGICVSLLCQGLSSEDAAVTCVHLHSLAGLYAKEALGEYFMTASDIIKYLPKAFSKRHSLK